MGDGPLKDPVSHLTSCRPPLSAAQPCLTPVRPLIGWAAMGRVPHLQGWLCDTILALVAQGQTWVAGPLAFCHLPSPSCPLEPGCSPAAGEKGGTVGQEAESNRPRSGAVRPAACALHRPCPPPRLLPAPGEPCSAGRFIFSYSIP